MKSFEFDETACTVENAIKLLNKLPKNMKLVMFDLSGRETEARFLSHGSLGKEQIIVTPNYRW